MENKIYRPLPVLNHGTGTPERHTAKSKTETIGYVSLEQRLNALMEAGQTLARARADQHHFTEDIEPDQELPDIPITELKETDITDIFVAQKEVSDRLKAKREAKEQTQKTEPSEDKSKVLEQNRDSTTEGRQSSEQEEKET